MSNLKNLNKSTSQSPLRDGFLDEIDKMSHENLKLVTRQCISNLQEAANLLSNIRNNNCDYDDEKKKILDDYKNLVFKIQQCFLYSGSSNLSKVDELICFNDLSNHHRNKNETFITNKESIVEPLPSKPCKSWKSNECKFFLDSNEDLLAYHQKLNKTLSKMVDDLRRKLRTRTQQWQVTLNLYLKEKYEHGERLTTLEKIAKEKYRVFHRETRKKAMQETERELDKESCVII